ncbi:hypothetical protein ABIF44_004900 [Bradyrhizobium japonicum]|uniref:hypothetical protein n=1 Tax=Bradyrhizobium japonicum TaxID=375 RepID=UPI000559B67A|nr:hypothetical protein [Bradyrhizobium japonicum]AJA60101.1 hypothetical protein RN69_06490 [Bradyrhizobium japonicum]MYV86677.1 hypothetical protein [Bradyrhizobium japonicum]
MLRLAELHALAMALAVVAFPAIAGPGPYCTPVNGRDQIAKAGNTCPVNYLASGQCCIALHQDSPKAFARLPGRACPTGTFTSATSYCVSLR